MSAAAVRVIFNADDFGLAPQANAAVVQLCRAGIVRSASLLVTGPAADEAIALARSLPALGVGLHLAWVHERPAAPPEEIPALLDHSGRLLVGHRQFMARFLTGRLPLAQVRREAEAQLQRMSAAGLAPTHLDSHQHLHLWPPLFDLCLDLCRQWRIPFLRRPGYGALFTGGFPVGPVRRRLMRHVITRLDRHLQRRAGQSLSAPTSGRQPTDPRAQMGTGPCSCADGLEPAADAAPICHADEVWGMLAAGHLQEALLVELLERLPPGLHEVMCHPATEPCDAYTRHHWGYEWAAEVAALQSPAVAALIRSRCRTVTNFRDAATPPT